MRRTQLERNIATRQKLVASATELLKSKRYAGFRTADVAELAGVSRGAQTHHYPQKDDLVIEVLEDVYRRTALHAFAQIASTECTKDQLLDALMSDAQSFFMGEDFLLTLDLLMVGGEDVLGQAVKRLAQEYRPAVEKAWLEAFLKAGFDRKDAEDVIAMTFSIFRGLSVRELIDRDKSRAKRLTPRWREMASEMLGLPKKTVASPRGRTNR